MDLVTEKCMFVNTAKGSYTELTSVYCVVTKNIGVTRQVLLACMRQQYISKHCHGSDYIHYLQDCFITAYNYYYFKCNQRIQGKQLLTVNYQ